MEVMNESGGAVDSLVANGAHSDMRLNLIGDDFRKDHVILIIT
jgi:hypothetical protein